MSSDRDAQLGEAIRAIPVPEREPDFMQDLVARLQAAAAERPSPEAATRTEEQSAPAHGAGATPAGPSVADLAGVRRRRRRRLVSLAAVAAAVAAVVLVMLFAPGKQGPRPEGLTRPLAPLGGPEPATARQVISASLKATGAAGFLKGTMIEGIMRNGRFVPGSSERFVMTAGGSYRVSSRPLKGGPVGDLPRTLNWLGVPEGRLQGAHDATQRTANTLWTVPGSSAQAAVLRDLAAGEPYLSQAFPATPPLVTLRSYMRQLLDAGPLVLRQVTIDGRRCWVISTTMATGEQVGVEEPTSSRVRIAVDGQTLFPVRFSSASSGSVTQVRITYASGGAAPTAGEFTIALPQGVHIVPSGTDFSADPRGSSDGFKLLSLGDKAVTTEWIGYQPAFPTWIPAGFVRAAATYRTAGTVSLAYRRGFDAIYVGAQPTEHGSGYMTVNGRRIQGHFDDPFAQLYGRAWRYYRSRTHDVPIRSGPFAGRVAHIVVDPSVLPHLWVRDPMFTATVSGDLSAADMVRVVESLATGEEVGAGKATSK